MQQNQIIIGIFWACIPFKTLLNQPVFGASCLGIKVEIESGVLNGMEI
jgi:hypothetical protein